MATTPDQLFVIWDLKSYRVLCICTQGNSCRALIETEPECAYGVIPSQKQIIHESKTTTRDLLDMVAEKIVRYQSAPLGFLLLKAPADDHFFHEGLIERSELLLAKAISLDRVNTLINSSRDRVVPTEKGWETTHGLRYQQAKKHREEGQAAGDDTGNLFLRQFAQARGLDLDHAADQIIFEYELITMGLFQTEEILLKYMHAIPRVKSKDELALLMREFVREFYLNARI